MTYNLTFSQKPAYLDAIVTVDVFQILSEGSKSVFRMYDAFAYLDVNSKGDMMTFAETVAVNRSLPVAVFSTVAGAEEWLLNTDRKMARADAEADPGKPGR